MEVDCNRFKGLQLFSLTMAIASRHLEVMLCNLGITLVLVATKQTNTTVTTIMLNVNLFIRLSTPF